jgi:hypothetical protein
MKLLKRLLESLFGTGRSKSSLLKEWTTPRSLPLGMTEFHEWAERIIAAAMVKADVESQKYALSDMILHLNPTEDHKEDAFFIKRLRKVAQNEIAAGFRNATYQKRKALADATAKLESANGADSQVQVEQGGH